MRLWLSSLVLLAAPSWAGDGYSSPTHRSHAGQMVCAKQQIGFGKENPAAFTTAFAVWDPVWCRVYWTDAQPFYSIDVSLNGKPWKPGWVTESMDGESRSWTTFQVILNSQQTPAPQPRWEKDWAKLVNQLPPGTHEVGFTFLGSATGGSGRKGSQPVLAQATLTLTRAAGFRLAVGGDFPADAWTQSKAPFGGAGYPRLRQAVAARFAAQGSKASDILDDRLDDGFIVQRYSDTGETYRRVRYTVLWKDTNGDGVCQIQSHILQQDQLQGGGWSTWRWRAPCDGSCPQGEMDCP